MEINCILYLLPHLFKVLIVWVNLVPYFSSVSDSFEVFIMKTLPAFDLTKCYLTQCEETHHLKQGNHGYSSNLKRKCRTISCKLLLTYNKKNLQYTMAFIQSTCKIVKKYFCLHDTIKSSRKRCKRYNFKVN